MQFGTGYPDSRPQPGHVPQLHEPSTGSLFWWIGTWNQEHPMSTCHPSAKRGVCRTGLEPLCPGRRMQRRERGRYPFYIVFSENIMRNLTAKCLTYLDILGGCNGRFRTCCTAGSVPLRGDTACQSGLQGRAAARQLHVKESRRRHATDQLRLQSCP